jgi:AcrR family transcriptional regulator
MGHLDRKLREKELVRQSILDAAIKIAIREGWPSVTIRKIADEIEYTPPIVYEHFQGKEDLFKELVYMGFRKMQKNLEELEEKKLPAKDFLIKVSEGHWNFAVEHSALYQLMFSLERPIPNEEMSKTMKTIKEKFTQIAKEGTDIHELLFSWMCLLNGTISFLLFNNKPALPFVTDDYGFFVKIMKRFFDTI